MLSTSSPDFSFFSPSKSSGPVVSPSPPVVRKRIALVPAIGSSSWCTAPPAIKRKSSPDLPRQVKKLRGALPKKARASAPVSRSSSRASSATESRPPSPQPIYRSSRSRSTSAFPAWDDQCPLQSRDWTAPEDGLPGEKHWSSEQTVKRLIKSYKPYFRNHDDPRDYRFKPHPTQYPLVELEYPNTGALERYVPLVYHIPRAHNSL
ncbi:hypothetical protein C0992_007111 [Termitomyces sp. T32_za158]|nr:hypothetical protein C0992_007111 [Termitomyces sp. T32_za158]